MKTLPLKRDTGDMSILVDGRTSVYRIVLLDLSTAGIVRDALLDGPDSVSNELAADLAVALKHCYRPSSDLEKASLPNLGVAKALIRIIDHSCRPFFFVLRKRDSGENYACPLWLVGSDVGRFGLAKVNGTSPRVYATHLKGACKALHGCTAPKDKGAIRLGLPGPCTYKTLQEVTIGALLEVGISRAVWGHRHDSIDDWEYAVNQNIHAYYSSPETR